MRPESLFSRIFGAPPAHASLVRTLQRRLALSSLLVCLVLLITVAFLAVRGRDQMLDYQLEQIGRSLLDTNIEKLDGLLDEDPALHIDFQIWQRSGQRVYQTSEGITLRPNTPLGFSQAKVEGEDGLDLPVRVFTAQNQKRIVQVMHSDELRRSLIVEAVLTVMVPCVLMLGFLAYVVLRHVSNGLAPLSVLEHILAERDPADTKDIELPQAPSELHITVQTLNQSFTNMRDILHAEREFLAFAAHELRTPIAALQLQVDNLSQQIGVAEAHVALPLQLSARRLSSLVHQLLLLTKLQSPALGFHFETLYLPSLVQEVLVELAPFAQTQQIELSFQSADTHVRAHAGLLRIAVRNIVENAIKYSPAAGEVHVRLTAADSASGFHRLCITDAGLGIAQDKWQEVIQPFVRLQTQIEGTGLGLTITSKIMQLHSGHLHLSAAARGKGLQVSLDLPPAKADT